MDHRSTLAPRRWLATAALVAVAAFCACTRAHPPITGRVLDEPFASPLVGDTYRILVRLPPAYDLDPTARFPVVVQLDATSFGPEFDVMAGVASQLAADDEIPEPIVVGVGYPYEAGFGEHRGRWRDYQTRYPDGTPAGAAVFLAFLRDELLPYVHATFRTDPATEVTLSGHSLGGFFALYTLLSTAAEADPPFGRFLAADSSTAEDDFLLYDLAVAFGEGTPLARRAYVARARYTGAVQGLYTEALTERLATHPGLGLLVEVHDTDHGGVMIPAFRNGLRHVLRGSP